MENIDPDIPKFMQLKQTKNKNHFTKGNDNFNLK